MRALLSYCGIGALVLLLALSSGASSVVAQSPTQTPLPTATGVPTSTPEYIFGQPIILPTALLRYKTPIPIRYTPAPGLNPLGLAIDIPDLAMEAVNMRQAITDVMGVTGSLINFVVTIFLAFGMALAFKGFLARQRYVRDMVAANTPDDAGFFERSQVALENWAYVLRQDAPAMWKVRPGSMIRKDPRYQDFWKKGRAKVKLNSRFEDYGVKGAARIMDEKRAEARWQKSLAAWQAGKTRRDKVMGFARQQVANPFRRGKGSVNRARPDLPPHDPPPQQPPSRPPRFSGGMHVKLKNEERKRKNEERERKRLERVERAKNRAKTHGKNNGRWG